MRRSKSHVRSTLRSTARARTRVTTRTRWRVPDDLGIALVAFRRAIRAHRRLAKLAPRFFDSAVIERERRTSEERRRWMDSWEPALNRVYGSKPSPPDLNPPLPPLPGPRTQLAVERELANWQLWHNIGTEALERHKRRRPHCLPSLARLARLYELGFDSAHLAVGLDPEPGQTVSTHPLSIPSPNRVAI